VGLLILNIHYFKPFARWSIGTLFLARCLVRVHVRLAPEVPEVVVIAPVLTSSPPMIIVTIPTRRERTVFAWEYEFPPLVFTNIAPAGVFFRACSISEAIVVAVDLQSVLQVCELLLARPEVRSQASSSSASCADPHTSIGSVEDTRLVVVPAIALFPGCTALVAKLCFAAAAIFSSARFQRSCCMKHTSCDGIRN
jgi:hypothetical protein